MLENATLSLFFGIATLAVAMYAALEFRMLLGYWRGPRFAEGDGTPPPSAQADAAAPTVTVMLPIYNEGAAVLSLIRAVAAFDYPRERMDIQVLDDSTDHTPALVADEVARLKAQGVRISHVRRDNRDGWKAGALDNALQFTSAEFVAIFDADFVPPSGYLRRALIDSRAFDDEKVAFLQGRWTYTNENQNLLTRTQAILLDRHFVVQKPYLMANQGTTVFNGSGGVLRRAAIDAVGGWSSDTLCEDLDLSYRCALAGWTGIYDKTLDSPSEIPADMLSFKLQQRRWAKGSAQCMRKLAMDIFQSKTLRHRSEDLYVVMGYIIHPVVLLYALLWPLAVLTSIPQPLLLAGQFVLFFANAVALSGFLTTAVESNRKIDLSSLRDVVFALLLGMSLMVNNTIAFIVGCFERFSVFERTPKQNSQTGVRRPILSPVHWGIILEVAFSAYMLAVAAILFQAGFAMQAVPCLAFGLGMAFFIVYQLLPLLRLPRPVTA